jgi:hypothetical protein
VTRDASSLIEDPETGKVMSSVRMKTKPWSRQRDPSTLFAAVSGAR